MKQFQLSNKVNPEKVFILQSSEIEKRLDPFYYVPSIRKLENQVKSYNPQSLRKHILSVSSGATPKTTEKEKYYSDKENGIPFLRVQNLSPTGILDTKNCKYINKETHENYLKRSQVEEGDLLVKITGVGRMAVASVAPDGFVGNTNQHMVVIKTGSKEKSELLAAYLNTDIAERLASRRATGGTRPALDYPALLSIPIILDERILKIRKKAIDIKQIKEKEADNLLNSIDDYLLRELDIKMPKKDNSLKNRIFKVNYNVLSGNRFDNDYNNEYNFKLLESLNNSKYKLIPLRKLLLEYKKGIEPGSKNYVSEGKPFVRVSDVNNFGIDIVNCNKFVSDNYYELHKENYKPEKGDILYTKDGTIGFCYLIVEDEDYLISSAILRLVTNNKVNNDYLCYILASKFYKLLAERESIGTVIKHLNISNFLNLYIPLPNYQTQTKISNFIKDLRGRASFKQEEAKKALIIAKKEIELLILGEL